MKRTLVTYVLFLILSPLQLLSQERDDYINVHFYPQALVPQDQLLDGPSGRAFRITEDTFLVWIDLAPTMFFTHETCYLLISKGGVRIKRGNWWPVLNGKRILLGEHGRYSLISPYKMPRNPAYPPSGNEFTIHVFPHELTSLDRLQDGPLEKLYRIRDNSMLIWVDLLPGAFFAHPTAYILVSRQNIRVEDGIWWPVLNGKQILYGESNKVGIISPFKISWRK
jgi:hypothetical protein